MFFTSFQILFLVLSSLFSLFPIVSIYKQFFKGIATKLNCLIPKSLLIPVYFQNRADILLARTSCTVHTQITPKRYSTPNEPVPSKEIRVISLQPKGLIF